MKIAQIMLGKGYGGAERAFVDTCLALSKAGHEVVAITDQGFSEQHRIEGKAGITTAPIPIFARWDPIARFRLYQTLKTQRPDIAHIHLRRAMSITASSVNRLRIPLAVSLHNYGNVAAFRRANCLIALTNGHRNYIVQHSGFTKSSMTPEDVTTIPNFSRFPIIKKTTPKNGALKLLAYGRFVPKKGFDVLIEAMALAIKENKQLHLTLIGDGPERSALTQQITNHDLGPHVTLHDWQSDLIPILDRHDVFVLPSRSEPFGIVLLEAMARGLGIITTRTEGPAEFLNSDCCEFVDINSPQQLAKAVVSFEKNRGQLQSKAETAQRCFEHEFSETVVVAQLVQKYQRCLESNS